MKKQTLLFVAITGAYHLIPTLAQAESGFIPRASIGVADYQFSQDARDQIDFPEVNFSVVFNMLGVGGTFYKDNYYIDLFFQHSDNQSDDFEENIQGTNFKERFVGDRKDAAVTVGMKILDFRGSVYGGYKIGVSEATSDLDTKLKFSEDGYFIGGNYSWPIGKGTLTFNMAVAFLDGSLKEDASAAAEAFIQGLHPGAVLDLDADSKATGLSYGISWSAPLSERFTYSVSVDANNYTFKDVDDDLATDPPDEFEEDFVTAKLSFSYHF